jgi:hypothetical protein
MGTPDCTARLRRCGGSLTCWSDWVNGVLGRFRWRWERWKYALVAKIVMRISAYWTYAYGQTCDGYANELR